MSDPDYLSPRRLFDAMRQHAQQLLAENAALRAEVEQLCAEVNLLKGIVSSQNAEMNTQADLIAREAAELEQGRRREATYRKTLEYIVSLVETHKRYGWEFNVDFDHVAVGVIAQDVLDALQSPREEER